MASNAVVPFREPANNVEAYRMSTDAADICKGIVVASAKNIQGRNYVCVEGWQAIAIAHGCAASARDVERVDGGVRAIGEVRRMSDGVVIAEAEGFVGEDEATWFGGETISYGKTKVLPKRADYAIRAMAQTRAISRACRSAFAHVVVMMNAGLQTTPAEEVPLGGFNDVDHTGSDEPQRNGPAPRTKLAQAEGEHNSKGALSKAVREITTRVLKAKSVEEIDAISNEDATIAAVKQARRDWKELLTGDPSLPEDIGLFGQVERKRAELAQPVDETFSRLLSGLDQCETASALETYFTANEGYIDALDDEQRREFEAAYEARDSAIALMAAHQ